MRHWTVTKASKIMYSRDIKTHTHEKRGSFICFCAPLLLSYFKCIRLGDELEQICFLQKCTSIERQLGLLQNATTSLSNWGIILAPPKVGPNWVSGDSMDLWPIHNSMAPSGTGSPLPEPSELIIQSLWGTLLTRDSGIRSLSALSEP